MMFAITLVPVLSTGIGECRSQKHEDLTVRVVAVNEKGAYFIHENMPEVSPLYNWIFGLTTPDYDYYDFGDVRNTFDVSVPYGSKLNLASESKHESYIADEAVGNEGGKPSEPVIIDGGTHMSLEMHKEGKTKMLDMTVLIPNEDGDNNGYGEYNFKYAELKNIPIDDRKIMIGHIEQFGDDSDTDYLVFVTKTDRKAEE